MTPLRLMRLGDKDIFTPNLARLRILAFAGPITFAVAVGMLTNLVLEGALPGLTAHVVASTIVAAGTLLFTVWMFAMLANVHSRLQRVARSEERRRISLGLHDDVIQCVYAVQLGLEASLAEVDSSSDARPRIDQAIRDLDEVVVSVRRHILDEDLS